MPVHVEVRLVRLALRLQRARGLLQKRHAELVRPGRHRQAHLQMPIDLLEILSPRRRRDGERLHPLAVEQHLQLVRFVQPFDLLVAIARQADLDLVLAILREGVGNQRTAARAQRQPFDVLLLRQVRAQTKRVAAGAARRTRPRAG